MNQHQCKAKGGTWKDGKCINNPKPSSKSIKNNYNPFKMWGSWIGLIIGIPLTIFWGFIVLWGAGWTQGEILLKDYILAIIPLPLSFIIGYGIHSLIRKYK